MNFMEKVRGLLFGTLGTGMEAEELINCTTVKEGLLHSQWSFGLMNFEEGTIYIGWGLTILI
jgi:hypothetical protein